uniref:TNF receptor superfamily member 4 n=1 Tax=Myotis lucifugus TaxID=59463 RepID=G1P6Z2_MYOLU
MCVGAQRPRAPPSALLLLGLALGAAAKLCPGNTYPRGSKCCHECPPGEQPASRCTNTDGTRCGKCETRSLQRGHQLRVKPCTQCNQRSGSETKRACTTTNDTLCSCRPGTQPHGGFKRGVDCAPCPPRHFSRGNNEACKPWTNCTAEGKHTLQAASSSSDAVCEDRTLPATQPGQTRGPSARPSTTQPSTRWTLTSQPPTSPPTEPPRGPELTAVLGLALGLGLLAPVAAALVLLLNCTVWRPPAAPKPPGGHGFRKPIQEEQSDAHSTLAKL